MSPPSPDTSAATITQESPSAAAPGEWARDPVHLVIQVVREISEAVVEGRDGEQMLNLIVQRSRDAMGAAMAVIGIPEPDGKHLLLRIADANSPGEPKVIRVAAEATLAADVLRTRSRFKTANMPIDPASYPGSSGSGPLLLVPIMKGEQAIGVIELGRGVDDPAFSEVDARLAELLAMHVALALEYGKRVGERVSTDRRLEALMEITQKILQGGDSTEVLGLIARRARELVGGDLSAISTPHPDGDSLVTQAADGFRADGLIGTRLPLAGSLSGWVFSTGRTVNLPDGWRDDRAFKRFATFANSGPALFVGFKVGQRTAGVIFVTNLGGGRAFTDDDIGLVQAFGAQAAMCLGYATVREGVEHLEALGAIEMASVDEIADALAKAIVDATHCEAALIFRQEADGSVRSIGSFGIPERFATFLDMTGRAEVLDRASRLGITRPAVAAMRNRSVVIGNPADVVGGYMKLSSELGLKPLEAHLKQFDELRDAMSSTTSVSVPLIYQGRVVGALSAHFKASDDVGETEVAFLRIAAVQAASTIENARLLVLAQENAALEERQRLARELHDSVSQALYGIALGTQTALDVLGKGPPKVVEPLQYVHQLAEAGLSEMRALIFALRPESLEKEGLVAALRKQAAALGARYQIAVVESLCAEPAIPLNVKQDLLRIAQEAMSNIAKHSRAGRVEVSLDSTPGFVVITISDDGIGFDAGGEFPGHLGLQSIRERARDLGGDMELSTAPGRGTQIRVAVSASPGSNDGSGD